VGWVEMIPLFRSAYTSLDFHVEELD